MNCYHVGLAGNFLDNGRYHYCVRYITVVADSPESAKVIVSENQDVVFEYFKERRDKNKRRILRLKETVKPSVLEHYKPQVMAIFGKITALVGGEFRKIENKELPTLKQDHPEWFI